VRKDTWRVADEESDDEDPEDPDGKPVSQSMPSNISLVD